MFLPPSPFEFLQPELTDSQGITVYGDGWSWSDANDSIVRYIRIRMGKGGTSGKDAITIASGARMIFDHVSVSWGRDETFSISGDAEDVTVQNSIIAQGLETHSCGGLMQTDGGISLFRNLYIDNKTRNPKVKGVNDFQNNVRMQTLNYRTTYKLTWDHPGRLQLGWRRWLHRRRQRRPKLRQHYQQLLHLRPFNLRHCLHPRQRQLPRL